MTQAKRSPRRPAARPALLAAALRAQSAGVCLAERVGGGSELKIAFVNDAFCRLSGHTERDLLGSALEQLHVDRADMQRVRGWLPEAKAGQPLTGEGFLVRADGSTVAVAWAFDPVLADAATATHVIATYRDLTEKRRLQEALVHAQRLDAVGRLAGGIAHDFNNLVSVINGYCEMLATHVLGNPQAMREVTEIHSAGMKAAALTQQLLAFSRRQPLERRVFNVNQLVRDNAPILQRLVGDAGRLEFELADDLANVRTDPAQFQQVLLNLVVNARDALRNRGRVVVSTANRTLPPDVNRRATDPRPGQYVVLTVIDNGTGMDAETMKHLFEPFFTTKPEGKGTGLGLALVYGVVQQSGGTISVASELLVGSKFEILLPAVTVPIEEPPPPVVALPSLRGNETVCFIEPDEVVRKMVTGMLAADGYRVLSLATAEEAPRDPAVLKPVQLLISTLRGESEAFARRLLGLRPDLRVLVIGELGPEAAVSWVAADRQVRLNKPYALSELLRATRTLLDA